MKRPVSLFKRLTLAVALLLMMTVAAAIVWPKPQLQVINVPGGDKLAFAGYTYGTDIVPPSLACRIVNYLPKPLAAWARKFGGPQLIWYGATVTPKSPQLVVWFRHVGTKTSPLSYLSRLGGRLADENGRQAGHTAFINASSAGWIYATFPVVPHRSAVLQCVLDYYGGLANPLLYPKPFGQVTFFNPVRRKFPQWQPEPLPATKKSGDLTARLDGIKTGVRTIELRTREPGGKLEQVYRPAAVGEGPVTAFDVSFISPRGTNEVWTPTSAELSDATGNVVSAQFSGIIVARSPHQYFVPPVTAYGFPLPGTLWPDENVWRLKLEAKRISGFAPDEFFTFKNVPIPPVGATNFMPITNLVKGAPVILRLFVRQPNVVPGASPIGLPSSIVFDLPGKPADTAIDVASLVVGNTNLLTEAEDFESSCGAYPSFIPPNAQTMDITVVVQKTRTVEFLVKPPQPPSTNNSAP